MIAAPLGIAASCGGTTSTADAGGQLPCDVDRIFASECRSCHSNPPKYGAPMPLVTQADLHANAVSDGSKKVYEMVGVRTHDDRKPMPQPPRPRLRADTQKTLDDWIANGAPQSGAACGVGEAGTSPEASTVDPPIKDPPPGCPNVSLKASSPWTMPQSTPDEYVCFGVSVSLSKKRHITSFWPKIDNATITHHALVYLSPTAVSGTPKPCSPGSVNNKQLVFGWAPGGESFEMPPEAGLPLEGTTHFVVQMHYSNLQKLAGEKDESSIDLCTTEELRPNDADVIAFGAYSFEVPPRGKLRVDCQLDVPAMLPTMNIFRSMPHMHQIGRTIGSTVESGGGAPTLIDQVDNWSFGVQPWNAVSAKVNGGDTVRTWCSWENGTDSPVPSGEMTSQEMCYHFVMYYPRISAPGWSWQAPLGLANCTETN